MQAWTRARGARLPAPTTPLQVQAFDTASRQVVPLARPGGTARMYVCGITPYDATHIGHANTYVAFDLLNRVWRDAGSTSTTCRTSPTSTTRCWSGPTATGVDWQRAGRAADRAVSARTWTALNVLPPEHYVGAVESIPVIAELIADPAGSGARSTPWTTPSTPTSTSPRPADAEFGSLSELAEATRRSRCSPSAAATPTGRARRIRWTAWSGGSSGRASPAGTRRSVAAGPAGTSSAPPSPWTCSGPDFDVQGGGSDLIFPHHEMCAAEARVATGQPFAQAYLHSGHGRARRGEDVEVARQPGLRLQAARGGRRPDGDPAGAAGPPLPRRLEWTDDELVDADRSARPLARGGPARRRR